MTIEIDPAEVEIVSVGYTDGVPSNAKYRGFDFEFTAYIVHRARVAGTMQKANLLGVMSRMLSPNAVTMEHIAAAHLGVQVDAMSAHEKFRFLAATRPKYPQGTDILPE